MIPRIQTIRTLPDYRLFVRFDDGKQVVYDVKTDMTPPGYDQWRSVCGLFNQVQLDESRTCVWWNRDIDLPSDMIYEYGRETHEPWTS